MENNEELIKRVEAAACEGAEKGCKSKNKNYLLLAIVILALVVVGGIFYLHYMLGTLWDGFKSDMQEQFGVEAPAESHDLVLEDNGFLGYTAADFAEAILGETTQLKKLEVYEAKISDATTLTSTSLGKWKIFSKTKVITYNGIATYTVDLTNLNEESIVFDEENKQITLLIPHAERGKINIPSDEMEFGDTEKGLLAFGELNLTPEQLAEVETEAEERMIEKLAELNEAENADRFAKMSVWETYQPIVSAVSSEYKLEVDFE